MDTTTCVYNIFEFTSLDDVFMPVRNTARVKYTCYDVSKKFLFIGANSGSLYVFLRNPLQYLRVLSNKEGPLIFICIASHDQYVAFATSKGVVVILEHNVSNIARVGRSGTPTLPPRCLHVSREHQGVIVTAMTWNDSGTVLFIADDSGKITSVTVNTPSKKTKTLFQESTAMIAQLDSKIVQMDFAQNKLLISTLTSCYLCDTLREQYSQIGSKPRAGEFGACFYNKLENQRPCIYAARPGSRLWEVDFDGSVLCTHQFKKALVQNPVPFVSVREHTFSGKTNSSCPVPNSVNFSRLLIIGKKFLLTWVKNKLLLINPASMTVLLWTGFTNDIEDVKVRTKKLYIWFVDGRFHNFQLLTIENGISKLLSHSYWKLSALLCDFYKSTVILASSRNLLPRHLLETLISHLSQIEEKELRKATEDLVASLQEAPAIFDKAETKGGQFHYHIESGIYVVNRPRGDLKQLSSYPECSTSGSLPTISKKADNGVRHSNGSTKFDESVANAIGKAANFQQESKIKKEPFTKKPANALNSQPSIAQSTCNAMKKSSSGSDIQRYKDGKLRLPRGSSLENFYYGYQTVPMPMPYLGGAFWDADPIYGYPSLTALNPGAALDDLRNSLTSKYKSGKESILGKIGVLEDHLKSMVTDDPPELLDVPTGNNSTSCQDFNSDLQNSYEETISTKISPILNIDLTELCDATKAALSATRNPSLISSISDHQILEQWVNVLISTQELMYCTLYDQSNASITCKPDIIASEDFFLPSSSKTRYNNQLCSSKNVLRRNSWPNIGCDKVNSNAFGKCKETLSSNGDETLQNVFKSCPSALESITICEQCSDQLPRQGGTKLHFEDFLWWCDMRLLDGNLIMQLQDAKADLCLLCHPTIFTKDPWGLRFDEQKLVSQLAAICFKTKTFGRIWKYSRDFACFKNITNLEQIGQASETHDPLKLALSKNETEKDDVVLDHARAIFVTNFFHLLDTKEVFRELHHDKQSTFQTWTVILSGVMRNGADRYPEFKSFNPLLSALSCQPQDFSSIIDKLLSEWDLFTARDVLYAERLRKNHARNIFIEYMDAINEHKSPRTEISGGHVLSSRQSYQEICKDPVVHVAWLSYLLQDGLQSSPELINCVCRKPRPWAHLLRWRRTDLILQILRLNPENRTACQRLCEQFGFWLGYLYLCHGHGSRLQGLIILVQLGDITLFSDHFNIAILPRTTDEWRAVLHLLAKKENRKNCCLFCEAILTENSLNENVSKKNILSFESVAPFLLKRWGTDTTLQLFKEIVEEFPGIKFSASFYRQCILSAKFKLQARNMNVNSSMFMNADVQPSDKNFASPQIRSHLKKEMRDCRLDNPELLAINRCPFREDFPCHWGINIDLSSLCHTCSLPLALPLASAHEGGIRIFPCGHGYHSQCITSNICQRC